MPGRNRYLPGAGLVKELESAAPTTCVFISHKREDSDLAECVADVLAKMGVDYWLDLAELGEPAPQTPSEHSKLAESIEAGVHNSTHLLALITPRTKGSWWVPFEIGTARSRAKRLAFLLHKAIPEMPSYFVFGEWLNDQEALLRWAEDLSGDQILAKLEKLSRVLDSTSLDRFLLKKRTYR